MGATLNASGHRAGRSSISPLSEEDSAPGPGTLPQPVTARAPAVRMTGRMTVARRDKVFRINVFLCSLDISISFVYLIRSGQLKNRILSKLTSDLML